MGLLLDQKAVKCRIMNGAKIGERKNVNLPGVQVQLPVLQEKDVKDLTEFGIPMKVDFIAASFVQSADDVKMIRWTLGQAGKGIKIISKIENEAGLANFDEILQESDSIMVARGDLGMEIPAEKVFLAQKAMINKCNLAGKPVVTATQMMESCINNPRPTRAEASDVANAVLDGTDVVMLSGETANGDFPSETVHIMRRICEEVERCIDYGGLYMHQRLVTLAQTAKIETTEHVCSSAVKAAFDMRSPLILACTETGFTARLLAKYRPPQPILAITADARTARQLQVCRGVQVLLISSFNANSGEPLIDKAVHKAKQLGLVKRGDNVVVLHGKKEECTGSTNLLRIVVVPESPPPGVESPASSNRQCLLVDSKQVAEARSAAI